MDNVIKLSSRLKEDQPEEMTFEEASGHYLARIQDGTFEPGKWWILGVTKEGEPQVSVNGFTTHELLFCLEALKGWIMRQ
jgi:hypothetical protein